MPLPTTAAMRPRAFLALLLPGIACWLGFVPAATAQRVTGVTVQARTVLHPDGTKTESTKDPVKMQQTETTFDERGVVIAEKVFLLNQNGDPMQGVIYDGAKNLVARVQFYFDDLGRVVEERCLNTRNEVFRRVIRQYDRSGRALPPQAFDYKVNAPHMSASTIDFTNMPAMPPRGAAAAAPQQPGHVPQIESASPQRAAQPAQQEEKKEKKGFRWPWQKK